MKPKVRFAPSPTGYLHIGGARTALFNWLFARHYGGDFVLRIEDTDQNRSTEESIEQIVDSLEWLGLDWDDYFRQTERTSVYEKYADKLLEEDSVYRSEGALWFRIPPSRTVRIEDQIMGDVQYQTEELKDFVVRRSDGTFTYNFACAVDDMDTEITHVMRGDDHLNNTPKQILIYEALNSSRPTFAHLPLILGEDGSRLSKRHGAASVLEYRRKGFLPEALINFLARLGWSHGDQEIFSKKELIELFGLENVGAAPATFGKDKLFWLNNHWMKQKDPRELGELLKKFLIQEEILSEKEAKGLEEKKLKEAARALRKRNNTLTEMAEAGRFIFQGELDYDKSLLEKHLGENNRGILRELGEYLQKLSPENFGEEKLEKETRSFLEERNHVLGDIAQACRVLLTGREVSPGLFETMKLVGKEKTVERLKAAPEL